MADVTVPTAPALASYPDVELMKVGTWNLASGMTTFTSDDLRSAVAALDCPSVRRPVLKLGHTDPRFDGEPAVGWVDNMAVAASGTTIVGDYVGMPGWLGTVIASAYPDRSIEGCWDFHCQQGHVHPFVITAVALLGVTAPGIGTLASLQDVATMYGVAASVAQTTGHVTITIHAKEAPVPNPTPLKVAASATTEDVRRAFYEDAPWSVWIEEIQLDPLQIIVVNDDDGERSRVPVVIDSAADGEDAVTFGTPVPVVIRYEDVPGEDAGEPLEGLAAKAAAKHVVFASRAESRPGKKPSVKAANIADTVKCATCKHLASAHADLAAGDNTGACSMANCDCSAMKAPATAGAPPKPPAEPVDNTNPPTEGADMSDTLTTGLRERLGIKAEAELDDEGLLAAVDEALAEQTKEPAAASTKIPDGKVLVSQDVLDELKISAKAGAEARAQQLAEARDSVIAAAVKDGKIAPARREFWAKKWDTDPTGAKADLDSIEKGLIPVTATGYAGGAEGDGDEVLYASMFGSEQKVEA